MLITHKAILAAEIVATLRMVSNGYDCASGQLLGNQGKLSGQDMWWLCQSDAIRLNLKAVRHLHSIVLLPTAQTTDAVQSLFRYARD